MVIKLTFTCLIGNFKVNSQFLLTVCIVCLCTVSDKTDKSLQTYSNLPRSNFVEIFGNRKVESLGYRVVVCVILCLVVLVELQLVTDTDRHRPMASTTDA